VDRQAFEELALQHVDAVFRMAMQLARHPDEAGDLVQETYLRALRVAERYEERGGGMRPWLFKILHNVFYTRIGRAKRQPTSVESFPGAAASDPPPDEPGPAWDLSNMAWEHVDERLKASIEELRPEYRTVLLLWGVEGLKYREIADIQDIPIGTVMSRLHRARAILMAQLSEFAEEMGLLRGSVREGSGTDSGEKEAKVRGACDGDPA
jgi:RNA polymerase sigma-70 factor (ECF subfamily)